MFPVVVRPCTNWYVCTNWHVQVHKAQGTQTQAHEQERFMYLMINRYTRPEMGAIWELHNKFSIWMEIEILACEAHAQLGDCGITPQEAAWIRQHANFTVEEIDEVEKVTNHDVIAFTTVMAQYIDADVAPNVPKPSRWVHYGMTSSDLGDTALSYQIVQACDLILADIKQLGDVCKQRAFEFENTVCVGRIFPKWI